MSDPNKLGRFVWHELLTNDVEAAIAFYTKVVGWKVRDFEHNPGYKILEGARGPSAGIMEMPEEARAMGVPPNWTSYVATPDCDATANRVEELGGRILRAPADIPMVGRFAVVQDPQGATFALFTAPSGSPEMPGGMPAIGEYSWHELTTTDLDAAWSFYSELFGWQKVHAMDMGDMGVYQTFGMGGDAMGGMMTKTPQMPGPMWLPYVHVKDTRRATDVAANLGAKIMNPNMVVPGGSMITVAVDPEGVGFAVHAMGDAAPAARPAKKAAKKATTKKSAPKKQATAQPKKKAAKKAAKKAVKKAARKKTARKKAARKKTTRKGARKKAARRPMRKRAARKTARRPARKKRK